MILSVIHNQRLFTECTCSSVSSSLSGSAANCWDDILELKLSEMTEEKKALANRLLGAFYDHDLTFTMRLSLRVYFHYGCALRFVALPGERYLRKFQK